jgi:hypothetical protein
VATNPQGKNTKNLVVNLPDWLYDAIKQLAEKNNMKLGAYVRHVLLEAKEKNTQFKAIAQTPAIMTALMEIYGPKADPPAATGGAGDRKETKYPPIPKRK